MIPYYPEFGAVPPPTGSLAARAWRGRVKPFHNDSELSLIVADLLVGSTIEVGESGELSHSTRCALVHERLPFAASLVNMDTDFEIVVLEFASDAHPQVYGVQPEISRRTYPDHPHLRDDQVCHIDGVELPGLCLYLPSDSVLENRNDMTRLLHFASLWLAQHLVWVRTSIRFAYQACTNPRPTIGGIWPARRSPHSPLQLLVEVSSDAECPCGRSRTRYANCCWPAHFALFMRNCRTMPTDVIAESKQLLIPRPYPCDCEGTRD